MDLENYIKELGYAFRDITFHSNGEYSCRLGFTFLKGFRGKKEFWGDSPMEAVKKAVEYLDKNYKEQITD